MSENKEINILTANFGGLNYVDLIQPNKEQGQVIKIINAIEELMRNYAEKITYTQMRNIYAIVKDEKELADLHKKRPRIAYIQARQDKEEAKKIIEFILDLMKVIDKKEQLREFKDFMETMVAYHKLYAKNNN